MIDLREAEVFVRQVTQLVDGGIDGDAAVRDSGEQFAEAALFRVGLLVR
jgi:hypothetical protein